VDLAHYLDIYVTEARDHLQAMNQALLALEGQPGDAGHLETLFRAAHTLKGMSAAMEFQGIAGVAHDLEDLLDGLRRKSLALTPDLADRLFWVVDLLVRLVEGAAAGQEPAVDPSATQALRQTALAAAPSPPAPATGEVVMTERAGWQLRVAIAEDCALKGARAFVVLRKVRAVAAPAGSEPSEAALRAGEYTGGFVLFFPPEADPDALCRAAMSVAEVAAAEAMPVAESATAAPAAVGAGFGEATRPKGVEKPAQQAEVPAASAPPDGSESGVRLEQPAAAVRLKVTLLDQLLEALADLVMHRSHVAQLARRHGLADLDEAVESYTGIVDRLQGTVLSMRMTPAAEVFNRFPRMVRDLARQQGKEVRLEIEGAGLELDRTILEKIADPLVHLLRNAVDHGIECPDDRHRAGKPVPACIRLEARRMRDKAVVEIRDDGRGLSPDEIARTAVERGLIGAEAAAALDPAGQLELICRPGFSTKAEVTGVSGRGVGMGVVKEVVDELGGILEIESQLGQGACFRLVLPLTMAILPAMLVRVGGELYAIPQIYVVRTVEVTPGEVRQLGQRPMIVWEERVVPLVALADLLEAPGGLGTVPSAASGLAASPEWQVVIVERGRHRYALAVDEIVGQEEIVLKPLTGLLGQIEGLAGATIRGEGQVVLVLDIPGLLRPLSLRDAG
jgi:two-component system chemotaxis sensor kinase CheA